MLLYSSGLILSGLGLLYASRRRGHVGSWLLILRLIIANASINMHSSAVPPSTKAPLHLFLQQSMKKETKASTDLIEAHKQNLFFIFNFHKSWRQASPHSKTDQHSLVAGYRDGCAESQCIVPRLVSDNLLSHLFLALNYNNFLNYLLFSTLARLVLCKMTFMCHRNATNIQSVLWVIVLVSFWLRGGSLLTAGTLLIAGPVYCEGQHVCSAPFLFHSCCKTRWLVPKPTGAFY